MNKLENITAYLCTNHKKEISQLRLTHLLYLGDWFHSLIQRERLTNINWIFDCKLKPNGKENFIFESILGESNFEVHFKRGSKIPQILYLGQNKNSELNDNEIKTLSIITKETKDMLYNKLCAYVYSTYPFTKKERFRQLNLLELAKEYHAKNNLD